MSVNSLIIPNTNQKLFDGDIVMLSRFPGMKWIVHYGWFVHDAQSTCDWYFESIPTGTKIQVSYEDLLTLTVISTNSSGNIPCCPPVPPYPPRPPVPPPFPGPHPTRDETVKRAMLTVDTIAQRNALGDAFTPHGKIVRVNDVGGQVKYYEWDSVSLSWVDLQLGTDIIKSMQAFSSDVLVTSDDEWKEDDDSVATCAAVAQQIEKASSANGPSWGTIQ